jgi:hypothetical protein
VPSPLAWLSLILWLVVAWLVWGLLRWCDGPGWCDGWCDGWGDWMGLIAMTRATTGAIGRGDGWA